MLELLREPAIIRVVATALLLLVIAGVRYVAMRRIIGGAHILEKSHRRQLFYLRSALTVALLVGLVVIWAGALQNLLLSLTAVMVAVVIATKELLMCLGGFLMRATGRLFSVGDWIECNGLRGEVTDHTLLSTTLLELEPPERGYGYTGRTLQLPNSLFLSHPVISSPFSRQFVLHRFSIALALPVDPAAGLERLQREAERAFEPYREAAAEANEKMDRRLGVDVPGPEPLAWLETTDLGAQRFRLRLFCPTPEAAALESEITHAFLQVVHAGEIPPAGGSAPAPAPTGAG
ncbi:MAG: mechanosensitive ion channel family protein [Halofilum sp. (in: g-proteobacteria)]|nr:mechanosensitive ion channel family protein [Halofilum sp. (in: g-proteobacteria)]